MMQDILNDIVVCFPNNNAKVINNEFGSLIVVTGKGAKYIANYFARENYYDGTVATLWRDVRHGLGYAIPLY